MITATWATLIGIVVLLLLSAFFSGSETALTAASRARMHALVKSGSKRAETVERLTSDKERLLGGLLLGNNLVNILASSLATSLLITVFGDTGVVYATVGMTLAVVIFSEVLPKTWAINHPDGFALAVAPFVRPVIAVFAPISIAVEVIVRTVLRLIGVSADRSSTGVTGVEEIRGTVDLLHQEGEVVKGDRDMLGGILDLRELEVSDVMVHRTRMFAIDADLPVEDIIKAVLESSYTRLPLYRGEPDEIVGIVHAKDVLRALFRARGDLDSIDIGKLAATPWFVPDTTPLSAQLNAFLKRQAHFALVVDEYGEVEGLITLEDILEEIVGDISDEYDVVIAGIAKQADGSYKIDGDVPVRDVNRLLNWNLPDEEATTIAGLVIHAAQSIPNQGQQFTFYGFRFRVLKKQRNRLTQIQVTPLRP
ncbi:MAG: HlyC/CorC family transporter [Alphaproteobacteria bacterium]|nr:HlyC/CorC family transporter [Alphaproteobacteria bacterium]